jgi:hypothetical protein
MWATRALHAICATTLLLASALTSPGARAQPPAGKTSCFDAAEQAQLLRYHGDFVGARPGLIACASEGCPAAVRRDCADWLAQVDAATPSVAIHARDSRGRDVIGVRVLIDGALVADKLGGTAIAANPGAHRIRLETSSGATFEEQVLLTEGQKERLVDATFSVELGTDGMPPSPGATGTEPPPGPGTETGGGSRMLLVGGFGVLGLVGLGVATYFEVAGQKEYSDLKNGCGATRSCGSSDNDSSKQKLYVFAPVSLGVGVISLGVAAGLLLLGHHAPPPSAGWRLDVMPTAGTGAAAVFAAHF